MHYLKTNFDKILNICKLHSENLVDEAGNIPRPGTRPRFSDLEVVALSMTSEALSINCENLLFSKLQKDYYSDFPDLISRRQYNDRRKHCFLLQKEIRERIAKEIDIDENIYTIDSKPIEICKVGKDNYESAPDFGYCASQAVWYYGYKFHAVTSINGVIHSFDLT